MSCLKYLVTAVFAFCACSIQCVAATVTFFDSSQVATLVTEGTTWDKIRSNGYYFTYTRDKLFTGGTGQIIGRPVRIAWPEGVEAQAVTAGPAASKAKITIERVDGDVFDFTEFTAQLLANTAGAGGSFEVVPFLNGEEILPDPVVFDATGYYWSVFHYDTSPNPWGSTAQLVGYDKYTIDLYVDFALTGLTFDGAGIPPPAGDYNQNGVADAADYVLWRTTDGTAANYDTWRAHFGQFAGSGLGNNGGPAVPELAGCVLLMLAVAGWSIPRRGLASPIRRASNSLAIRGQRNLKFSSGFIHAHQCEQ